MVQHVTCLMPPAWYFYVEAARKMPYRFISFAQPFGLSMLCLEMCRRALAMNFQKVPRRVRCLHAFALFELA